MMDEQYTELLKVEVHKLLDEIDHQIDAVKETAKTLGVSVYLMKQPDGTYVLTDLLAAKAQLLCSLLTT